MNNIDEEIRTGHAKALEWSVEAMTSASQRVNQVYVGEPSKAFAAFGEAVWWITVVNDSLKNQHPDEYKATLKRMHVPADDTIAGLKSVRNRLAHEVDVVDFVRPHYVRDNIYGEVNITLWQWMSVRPPTSKGKRDVIAYEAYERALAGQNVGHTFKDAIMLLANAAADAQKQERLIASPRVENPGDVSRQVDHSF